MTRHERNDDPAAAVERDHQMALEVGMEIRSYRIERELGSGSFGITYLGRHVETEGKVAIKEYLPRDIAYRSSNTRVEALSRKDESDFEWGLERFLEEAKRLEQFRGNPNVVGVRDFFREFGTAYIVMEYCEGESLGDILEREQ